MPENKAPFKVSMADILNGTMGICLGCGELANCVEPDARKYVCDNCEANKVYGLEEALIMGAIEVKDEHEESEPK